MGQANLFAVVACAGVLVMYQNLDQMQLNVVPYSQWPAVLSMKLMAQLAPSASSSPTQSTGQGAAQEMVDGGEDTNEIDLMKDDAQDLLRKAENGNVDAQYNVAMWYYLGVGVTISDKDAARWMRKAADNGKAEAQFGLGTMHEDGRGVNKNLKVACAWYRKAAAQGDSAAQNNLGLAYSNGKGVPFDRKVAAEWYEKAADQGLAAAQYSLGLAYHFGQGVDEDKSVAEQWFRKAAAQGHKQAEETIIDILAHKPRSRS